MLIQKNRETPLAGRFQEGDMEDADTSQMIDALIQVMRENGSLKSAAVEQAFRNVPRHFFVPGEPLERVYQDKVIFVKKSEEGVPTSASSQPSIMAVMLEQLDLQPGMRVLEIGAGTGYNAALMAYLVEEAGSVVTVDIQPDLIEQARSNLDRAGFARVQAVAADGGEGYPPGAPYDRIILTVSSWVITPAWRDQLKDGGRLVLPLALNGPWAMVSIAFERQGDELTSLSSWGCGFMPLKGAFAAPPPVQIHPGPGGRLVLTSQQSLPVDEQTFSEWLADRGAVYPTGVRATVWDFLPGFHTWLNLRSPDGIAILSGDGDAAEDIASLALIAVKGQAKSVETFVKILPGSAAVVTRPPGSVIQWFDPELPEKERVPEQPFEVTVQQLGPNPEAALFLVRMIQAWDAAGRPDINRLRARGFPAGTTGHFSLPLREGQCFDERPWTHFIAWYQD
jgi:protein-L-isoaspartate(D-aspartate) O-methyltransferase